VGLTAALASEGPATTSAGAEGGTDSGSLAARRLRHRSVSTTAVSPGAPTASPPSGASLFAPVAEGGGGVEELQALLRTSGTGWRAWWRAGRC